jgi:hypothetical protein
MTMRDSQRNLEVVKSTIDLAHRLGAVAVAEGIEDAPTLALLEQWAATWGKDICLKAAAIFRPPEQPRRHPPQPLRITTKLAPILIVKTRFTISIKVYAALTVLRRQFQQEI